MDEDEVEEQDDDQDQEQDGDDHDIIQPHKITVGAEENNVNIEEDEFVIDDETARPDDGEMGFEEMLRRQQPHHELQFTNAASEGGSDDVHKL